MTKKKTPEWPMGPLTRNKAGRHYVEPSFGEVPKERICNSMMPTAQPGEISGYMKCPVRPGSDHSHIQSRGGC